MLINQTTGPVRCDMCDNDLEGPSLVDEHGTTRCRPCEARQRGYDAGYDNGMRNMFEAAVAGALDGGATEADLRDWLEVMFRSGPMLLALEGIRV